MGPGHLRAGWLRNPRRLVSIDTSLLAPGPAAGESIHANPVYLRESGTDRAKKAKETQRTQTMPEIDHRRSELFGPARRRMIGGLVAWLAVAAGAQPAEAKRMTLPELL